MALKPDQERVRNLLTETLTLLCKNGLTFNDELKVEAVIGVTVDKDVFIVHVNDSFKNPDGQRAESPDVQASDEPPPGLREKEQAAARRRQQQQKQQQQKQSPAGGKKRRQGEVFVDLTGRDTPGPMQPSPQRHMGQSPFSSPGRSPRMGTPPTTPGRRGPYMTGTPRTPTGPRGSPMSVGGRFRQPSPQMQYQQQMRGAQYMSPQQMGGRGVGPYSPRQTFSPQQSPSARRSLNSAMNQRGMPTPPHMPGSPLRQASPLRTRMTQNGSEVIVLDDPANRARGSPILSPASRTGSPLTASSRRVIGSMTTGEPQQQPEPLTIEPVTIQPVSTHSTSNEPQSPATSSFPSPPVNNTTQSSSQRQNSTDDTVGETPAPRRSPLTEAPVLTETEDSVDDSLSRLASVIGDQQRARLADDSAPGTPTTPSASVSSPQRRSSSPVAATEATIAALEEVAKSTVEELQKTSTEGDTATPPIVVSPSALTPGVSPLTPTAGTSSDDATSLSVCSIQGNFSRYDNLGTFKAVKKPPAEDASDEPPAKKRAVSPSATSAASTSDAAVSEGNVSDVDDRNGTVSPRAVKAERVEESKSDEKKQLKTEANSTNESTDEKTVLVEMFRQSDKNLSTWQVRELLERQIVTPVLKKQESTVTAFRLFWRGSDPATVEEAWRQVVARRKDLDDMVAKETNLSFFISSITAENTPAAAFPCVGYWVVTRHPAFDKEAFLGRVTQAAHGADLRMVLKADGGAMDEFGALCLMVKDYGDGLVQRRIAGVTGDKAKAKDLPPHPTVRFILREKFFEHMLKNALKQLRDASFTASLEKVIG